MAAGVRIDVLLDGAGLRSMLERDVRTGLARSPKAVRSRWVWDARGSELFERIMELPSYDLPRRERALLAAHGREVAALVRPASLVELGAGSAARTPILLDALTGSELARYVAVDVSEAALRASLPPLARRYPGIEVAGAVADFERQLDAVDAPGPRLVALLGSTIGALELSERAALLRAIAGFAGAGGALLVGVDLLKPVERLLASYDHPDELGGELIMNLLPVLNRELGAGFRLDRFRSERSWNEHEERLETAVRSLGDQVVPIPGLGLEARFAEGETLRTQISTKFRREGLAAELAAAGLTVGAWWPDADDGYALCLADSASDSGGPMVDASGPNRST